ncbi:septal ring lytic transglycosylase RlpA family protein [Pelomonas sp. APW6]|uniref:Endolytic peptidoglycan transglycosylase RlpA n=1 Tax=Roseateles subflavus TaxID=3053353 RepID=A0ABT7LBP8_9BURK|nr:septal ring lytic transglycosylase RlpA family protein [Pelomonas sp. APW6]MDL5030291.1 septal ring lytic transglycosylase RlpA family protein [Pelomonas sp. APW6]
MPSPGPGVPRAPAPGADRDGPQAQVPPNLGQVPDAEPRLEPIRKGGPNKPYEVAGQRYEPLTDDSPLTERGLASWYGRKFHGRPTSSGELYNMYAMTAAHATMPIPSYARVRNPANGREVIVRINDRGPFHPGRIVDLSYTAALKLDVLRGVTPVEVERITYDDIRTGAWQRRDDATRLAQARDGRAAAPAAPVAPVAPAPAAAALPPVVQGGAGLPQDLTPPPAPRAAIDPPLAQTGAAPGIPDGGAAPKAASKGFWVQLGAFSRMDGAEAFRQKLSQELDWMAPLLAIFKEAQIHRLQAGPYASREDARSAAERMRQALALTPVIVERR